MDGGGAKRVGERLLGEVEVEGLSELLASLREITLQSQDQGCFGIAELDALLPSPTPILPAPQDQPQPRTAENNDLWDPPDPPPPVQIPTSPLQIPKKERRTKNNPILELISPPPTHHPSSSGKTSLCYLITALATLPPTFRSTPLSGQNSAVIIIDPLSHFSALRLAEIMTTHITTRLKQANLPLDAALQKDTADLIKRSLVHAHIFHPSSWPTLLATLRSLPDYLFDASRHQSITRRVHSIILLDIDAFAFQIRNTTSSSTSFSVSSNPLAAASGVLTSHLLKLASQFSAAVVLTAHSTTPSTFRPALPVSWAQGCSVTRLAVRRVEVLKFAPGISVEEAERERAQRWEVVSRGRCEASKVGAGARDGEGFVFRVGGGVEMEQEM